MRGRVVIAGAGVFGLCAALGALRAGCEVEVYDPALQPGAESNASRMAAGMISPFGELLLDAYPQALWPLFRSARDLWRDLEVDAGELGLRRDGAVFTLGPKAKAAREIVAELRGAAPLDVELEETSSGVRLRTFEDWTLDPQTALPALARTARAHGARLIASRAPEPRSPEELLVLAAGASASRFASKARELEALQPIKGHLLRFEDLQTGGAAERSETLYFAPQPTGLVVGATMEPGRADAALDPRQVAALHRAAVRRRPDLEGQRFKAAAGIRGGFPDRLPLIGPSSSRGVFLAAGARRNGWLFGPLVGELLWAYLTGRGSSPLWRALGPRRFAAVA